MIIAKKNIDLNARDISRIVWTLQDISLWDALLNSMFRTTWYLFCILLIDASNQMSENVVFGEWIIHRMYYNIPK